MTTCGNCRQLAATVDSLWQLFDKLWQPVETFDKLCRVKADDKLNFKKVFDDNNDIYNGEHYCEYVEIDEVSKLTTTSYFSTYSHNVRSLQGHFDDLVDLLDQAKPHKFSVLALQEIWSVSKEYSIPACGRKEYCTV